MAKRQTETPQLQASNLKFLEQLSEHNNREWFNEHKDRYLLELEQMETFAEGLLSMLSAHDVIETPSGKQSLQRIYRDTRFSKDKTPYKTHWSGGFRRATKFRRGGYYFQIQPGNKTFVGGGFWNPNAEDIKRIREDIAFDPAPLRKILNSASFRKTFGVLQGEQLKTAPKGFDAGHEAIDLLRYKQFLLIRTFTDKEVLDAGFMKEMNRTFEAMRPFLDYMSDVLSTDENGLSI
ncbi:DUF2461 domain-containing protein [Chitinophaga vietnamensis]|uniref:DUF2461 domain-containing protein n=1 Tax=Chitinophaga vietnamensis TaxID=2593957 RepID=UPI0011783CCB|nr:DUF2461 domain-containing protein [Chitinophaga vietnamensis]